MPKQLVLMPTASELRLLCFGNDGYLILPPPAYDAIKVLASSNAMFPKKLAETIHSKWGLEVSGRMVAEAMIIRERTAHRYHDASWEISMRCDYDCRHCYLGPKPKSSLAMPERLKVLDSMSELGVHRLQITGGEPLIDPHFVDTYLAACERGMLVRISTNGSQLHREKVLGVFEQYRPLHLTISMYGASAESYESLTRTEGKGTFDRFLRGLVAVKKAGIKLRINIVVTSHNDHEIEAMQELARQFTDDVNLGTTVTPTYYGDGRPQESQSVRIDLRRKTAESVPFTGCSAGTETFHVDQYGQASMCMIGRDFVVDLTAGVADIYRLVGHARTELDRADGCISCSQQSSCGTCPVIVKMHRKAGASPSFYCRA